MADIFLPTWVFRRCWQPRLPTFSSLVLGGEPWGVNNSNGEPLTYSTGQRTPKKSHTHMGVCQVCEGYPCGKNMSEDGPTQLHCFHPKPKCKSNCVTQILLTMGKQTLWVWLGVQALGQIFRGISLFGISQKRVSFSGHHPPNWWLPLTLGGF